jgi:hypothetical protein
MRKRASAISRGCWFAMGQSFLLYQRCSPRERKKLVGYGKRDRSSSSEVKNQNRKTETINFFSSRDFVVWYDTIVAIDTLINNTIPIHHRSETPKPSRSAPVHELYYISFIVS